jgi:hypothetical protein
MKAPNKSTDLKSMFKKAFENLAISNGKSGKPTLIGKPKAPEIFKLIKKPEIKEKEITKRKRLKKVGEIDASHTSTPKVTENEATKSNLEAMKSNLNEGNGGEKVMEREKRNHVSCPFCKSPLLVKSDISLLEHYSKCANYR